MQRMPVTMHAWLPVLVALAQEAGEALLAHYAEQRGTGAWLPIFDTLIEQHGTKELSHE